MYDKLPSRGVGGAHQVHFISILAEICTSEMRMTGRPACDCRDKEQVRVGINAAMRMAQCSSAHPSYCTLLAL